MPAPPHVTECKSALLLDKLMRPRSIAVVGASERVDALGTRVIRNLQRLGYQGRIFAGQSAL